MIKDKSSENRHLLRGRLFDAWSQGGTFAEIGRMFAIPADRARDAIWRAITRHGHRSARAREWMIRLDGLGKGDYVHRYDNEWHLPRHQAVRPDRLGANQARESSPTPALDQKPNSSDLKSRRLEIFRAWSQGGSFGEVADKFGIKRARAREIVWKVIAFEGGRSTRAREWMEKLDRAGGTDYVRKYDQEWIAARWHS